MAVSLLLRTCPCRIKSHISKDASSDIELFETAIQVLHCMSGNGNFAAAELFQNLNEVKQCLQSYGMGGVDHSKVSVQISRFHGVRDELHGGI